jgi:hypothetical protein
MTLPSFYGRWIGLPIALALATGAGGASAADISHPTVVELFQSQGCSSCPPANANLLAIADRADVLALSWEVTYWDYLGWTDTFGDRRYTQRQWDYARALRHTEVYTPQIVVNGRTDLVGDHTEDLDLAIAQADRGQTGPTLQLTIDHVTVGPAAEQQGEVVLVRYDPRLIQVPIQHGENGGRTLPHRNVVREVLPLGAWHGTRQSYVLPAATLDGLKTAILVQAGPGGRILAATHS